MTTGGKKSAITCSIQYIVVWNILLLKDKRVHRLPTWTISQFRGGLSLKSWESCFRCKVMSKSLVRKKKANNTVRKKTTQCKLMIIFNSNLRFQEWPCAVCILKFCWKWHCPTSHCLKGTDSPHTMNHHSHYCSYLCLCRDWIKNPLW